MALLSTFTGVGGDSLIRIFTASTTFSPTADIVANVYVVGGGGGGMGGINGRCGGGGGCAIGYRLNLSSATTYTITIGGGGEGGWGGLTGDSTGDGLKASTAGGASSFSGSGITTLTGNGGARGGPGGSGVGGSATGGTYNYTGGTGGSAGGIQEQAIRGGVCGLFGTMDGGRGMPFEFGHIIPVDGSTNSGTALSVTFMRGFSGTGLNGGSAVRGVYSTQGYPYGGAGGYGAGGGGAYQTTPNSTYDALGGSGGPGFVIIQGVRL